MRRLAEDGVEAADEVRFGNVSDRGYCSDVQRLGVCAIHSIARPKQTPVQILGFPAHAATLSDGGKRRPKLARELADDLKWPSRWQQEAIDAAMPHVGQEARLDILVDDPATAIHGTRMVGFVYAADDGTVMILHDRSGKSYPWKLLMGPVLEIKLLQPRRRAMLLYRHPDWHR